MAYNLPKQAILNKGHYKRHMALHNETGKIGEEIASMFLKKRGYSVFMRNLSKKYGEIDIIAKKGSVTHFIEVKTVSRERFDVIDNTPEQNVAREKLLRLKRVISQYIMEKGVENWEFGVIAVFLERNSKKALVRFHENEPLPE